MSKILGKLIFFIVLIAIIALIYNNRVEIIQACKYIFDVIIQFLKLVFWLLFFGVLILTKRSNQQQPGQENQDNPNQ